MYAVCAVIFMIRLWATVIFLRELLLKVFLMIGFVPNAVLERINFPKSKRVNGFVLLDRCGNHPAPSNSLYYFLYPHLGQMPSAFNAIPQ